MCRREPAFRTKLNYRACESRRDEKFAPLTTGAFLRLKSTWFRISSNDNVIWPKFYFLYIKNPFWWHDNSRPNIISDYMTMRQSKKVLILQLFEILHTLEAHLTGYFKMSVLALFSWCPFSEIRREEREICENVVFNAKQILLQGKFKIQLGTRIVIYYYTIMKIRMKLDIPFLIQFIRRRAASACGTSNTSKKNMKIALVTPIARISVRWLFDCC